MKAKVFPLINVVRKTVCTVAEAKNELVFVSAIRTKSGERVNIAMEHEIESIDSHVEINN